VILRMAHPTSKMQRTEAMVRLGSLEASEFPAVLKVGGGRVGP